MARRVQVLTELPPRRVVEPQRTAPIVEADQWLTKTETAKYLSITVRTFDNWRKGQFAEPLKPCLERPLRWSRNALDVFKFTRAHRLNYVVSTLP